MNKNFLNQLLGMFATSKGKSNELDILMKLISGFKPPEELFRGIQSPGWVDEGFRPSDPRHDRWGGTRDPRAF